MTKRKIAEIKKHIEKISDMELSQLQHYCQQWYLNKQDLDVEVFDNVLSAMDIRMANLKEYSTISPMAVMSEISED